MPFMFSRLVFCFITSSRCCPAVFCSLVHGFALCVPVCFIRAVVLSRDCNNPQSQNHSALLNSLLSLFVTLTLKRITGREAEILNLWFTDAMRPKKRITGRTRSGGPRFCADRSEAETLNLWFTDAMPPKKRITGRTRSGGPRFCADRSEAETLNLWFTDAMRP